MNFASKLPNIRQILRHEKTPNFERLSFRISKSAFLLGNSQSRLNCFDTEGVKKTKIEK